MLGSNAYDMKEMGLIRYCSVSIVQSRSIVPDGGSERE